MHPELRRLLLESRLVLNLDWNHNAMSSKDRSSLFGGKIISRPDERVGKEVLAWLHRGKSPQRRPLAEIHNQPTAARVEPVSASSQKPRLFNDAGNLLGERETTAMLDAVAKAASQQRLLDIEKSWNQGLNTGRLTSEQAHRVRVAIHGKKVALDSRQKEA
jgi:hypothetical protein